MLVLGIETTCDETAAALVERDGDGNSAILANIVLSQIADHAAFGGVVPEIAARAHVEALDVVIATAMADAGKSFAALDGVAAAAGPGLIGGVIVGLTTGKAIAMVHEKPLIAVNHLEAHALTARLTDAIPFPYCLFLASGGHTQIVAVRGVGDYVRLGTTRDDAIGEAFDKTAKLLGLGYPGGPRVEKEAERGDRGRFLLPRPMSGRHDADFSLSGLKTAVRLEAEKIAPLSQTDVADLCASFQFAVVEMVVDRVRQGLRLFRQRFGMPSALVAAGGVAANQPIREALLDIALAHQLPLAVPPPALCGDNAAIVAWAGAERLAHGLCDALDVAPRPRWPLEEVTKPAMRAPAATPVPLMRVFPPALAEAAEPPRLAASITERLEADLAAIPGKAAAPYIETKDVDAVAAEPQEIEPPRMEAQDAESRETEPQALEAQVAEIAKIEPRETEPQATESLEVEAQAAEAPRTEQESGAQEEPQTVDAQTGEQAHSEARNTDAEVTEPWTIEALATEPQAAERPATGALDTQSQDTESNKAARQVAELPVPRLLQLKPQDIEARKIHTEQPETRPGDGAAEHAADYATENPEADSGGATSATGTPDVDASQEPRDDERPPMRPAAANP